MWLSTKHAPDILFVKERNVMNPIPELWVWSVNSSSPHSSHLSDLTANKIFQDPSSRWADITGVEKSITGNNSIRWGGRKEVLVLSQEKEAGVL